MYQKRAILKNAVLKVGVSTVDRLARRRIVLIAHSMSRESPGLNRTAHEREI